MNARPASKPSNSENSFADELGVHRTYMGGIERGERNLTLKSLERIASQIDLDPLALLQPPEAESTPPPAQGHSLTARATRP
jgi:transcriptional regulator with XRE-family HTH domain